MPRAERNCAARLLFLTGALLALVQSGCLLALAGVAAGGAATGYLYCKGRIYRDYPANLQEVHNAVHAALLDLHFGIFNDETKDGKAFLVTKTTNGKKVKIYLDCLASPIPAEGLVTRVSIRVGAFGDENISMRILDQVAWRLAHGAPALPAPPPGAPAPIQQTSAVRPAETPPPPLAPPPAKK